MVNSSNKSIKKERKEFCRLFFHVKLKWPRLHLMCVCTFTSFRHGKNILTVVKTFLSLSFCRDVLSSQENATRVV